MADPTTPNLDLTLPAAGELDWNVPLNENFVLIDTFSGTAVVKAPTATQKITQPAGTYLSLNALQMFGSVPSIAFGTISGTLGMALSMKTLATLSIDQTTPGDALGTLACAIVNVGSGFQINQQAPLNSMLIGNGVSYVGTNTLPPGLVNYQYVKSSNILQIVQPTLNFLSPLVASNNSGNLSTDVSLVASGVAAGTYTRASLTVNASGQVTSAQSATRVATGNGFYIQYPDGTIDSWGNSQASATGSYTANVAITFPAAFTTTYAVTFSIVGTPGTTTNMIAGSILGQTLNGFTVVLNTGNPAAPIVNPLTINWRAIGY